MTNENGNGPGFDIGAYVTTQSVPMPSQIHVIGANESATGTPLVVLAINSGSGWMVHWMDANMAHKIGTKLVELAGNPSGPVAPVVPHRNRLLVASPRDVPRRRRS